MTTSAFEVERGVSNRRRAADQGGGKIAATGRRIRAASGATRTKLGSLTWAIRPADEAGRLLANTKWALPSRPPFMVERPNLESLGFDCDRRSSRGAAVGC